MPDEFKQAPPLDVAAWADEPKRPPPLDIVDDQPKPRPAVKSAAPIDQGLADWSNLVRDQLLSQGGVQIQGTEPGAVRFSFRGQNFIVHVLRVP